MIGHVIFTLALFAAACLCTASLGVILVAVFRQMQRRKEGADFYDEEGM